MTLFADLLGGTGRLPGGVDRCGSTPESRVAGTVDVVRLQESHARVAGRRDSRAGEARGCARNGLVDGLRRASGSHGAVFRGVVPTRDGERTVRRVNGGPRGVTGPGAVRGSRPGTDKERSGCVGGTVARVRRLRAVVRQLADAAAVVSDHDALHGVRRGRVRDAGCLAGAGDQRCEGRGDRCQGLRVPRVCATSASPFLWMSCSPCGGALPVDASGGVEQFRAAVGTAADGLGSVDPSRAFVIIVRRGPFGDACHLTAGVVRRAGAGVRAIVKSGVRRVGHAAALLSSMSSIPSLNLTPSMSFASWRNPRSRRQDFSAHRPIL